MTRLLSALTLDILCALATHRWFNHHEPSLSWDLTLSLTIPLLTVLILVTDGFSLWMAFQTAYILFFTALFLSIVAYRLSPFHPLAGYPGPALCKISQLWTVIIHASGKSHHYRKLLHDRYGSIVRIGPNELSVTEKDMLPYILGAQGMPRGPMFEGRRMTPLSDKDMKHYNLMSTRDLRRHAVLRKAWNKAFAKSPLTDYEELMLPRAYQLIDILTNICKAQCGVASVDIAMWIGYFTFDFMGDIAFGGGFELMRHGDPDRFLRSMSKSHHYAYMYQAIPWFSPVLRNIPYFGAAMRAFGSFGINQAKIRYNQEPGRKDLFYHMIAAYQADSLESPFQLIASNALLAIVAGSDTTATVLKKIDTAFPPTETCPFDTEILPRLPVLNAVINEALRLQPPVPTTIQRAPARGTKGKLIGTHYLKEGTNIQVSPYVLHRDPRYFSPRPNEFWPDRWMTDPSDTEELVLDLDAFIPFSMGPANCPGKPLAMLELRAVVSLFIMHLDMQFEDDFDQKAWVDSLKDYFLMETGELKINLRLRKRKSLG